MHEFVHIESIDATYDFLGSGKPAHPLITVIRQWPESQRDISQIRFTSDLYYVAMKGKKAGALRYGRNSYDYQQGTLIFIAPGQTVSFSQPGTASDEEGWTILFHPDLVHQSGLEQDLRRYSYFSYETDEALHLSDQERKFIDTVVGKIEQELHQNLDRHSRGLVVHHLQTIFKYCDRYYERQFHTRAHVNKGHAARFERYLHEYFDSPQLKASGPPTVEQCGKALNMSGSYLSDLLRTETGRSAKDHIYSRLIELAKSRLSRTWSRKNSYVPELD